MTSSTTSRDAATRQRLAGQSPVMILIVLVSTFGILVYSLFLLDPDNRGDMIPWLMVIAAESVLVFHALLAMWTILSGGQDPRSFAYHQARDAMFGPDPHGDPRTWPVTIAGKRLTIDVFITVYGEDLAVIRRTAEAALALRGEHRTWILDDGRSDEVRDMAAQIGARYVRRLSLRRREGGQRQPRADDRQG
ncbi:glycosyltransferase family 2 protein [Demequina litorisediminis]|uniref:Glycosyl transferase family 2 n=1 Tax=Demequina litorisediminis TaxID=1849022 RepID=A0ABQ6IE64_9MICO|nr:glycosyltransferase family 2 protein [Demequina litorisediminis]GMA36115.1 hypothetical protein GCM10025876_23190 [Demequina litorisediminis]